MNFFWTMMHFFHMGGYARFVWPVYLFAGSVLFLNIYFPYQERKKILKKLERLT